MQKKRLGIFGGTFDPPHIGHLILAAEARDQLELNSTIWVLTPDPPHKQENKISSTKHRLAMVQRAIGNDQDFSISRVDIDRPGPHFSVDTVSLIKLQFPDHQMFFLMGGDLLQALPKWHKVSEFVNLVDGIGVMRRPGDEINLKSLYAKLPSLKEKIHFVTAPLLEISSAQIRQRVMMHRAYRYYLLPSVYKYICEHYLYLNEDLENWSPSL